MAMMSEFLQLNNHVVSKSFLTLSKMICSFTLIWALWTQDPCFLMFCFCPSLPLFSEDKAALAKLVEAIKTNYNDRYEEVSLFPAVVAIAETNTLQLYYFKLIYLTLCNQIA